MDVAEFVKPVDFGLGKDTQSERDQHSDDRVRCYLFFKPEEVLICLYVETALTINEISDFSADDNPQHC